MTFKVAYFSKASMASATPSCMCGYGRAYPVGRRQIVVSRTHLSDDERYTWLNDTLSVGVGEVRAQDGPPQLVIERAELAWEPIGE
jgi:hypothetical protein